MAPTSCQTFSYLTMRDLTGTYRPFSTSESRGVSDNNINFVITKAISIDNRWCHESTEADRRYVRRDRVVDVGLNWTRLLESVTVKTAVRATGRSYQV